MLLTLLHEERANQLARADSLNVVAAALLGFESVLVVLLPGFSWGAHVRNAGLVFLALSMLFLVASLSGWPLNLLTCWRSEDWSDWWRWRKKSKGALAVMDIARLATYLPESPDVTALHLYATESKMITEVHRWLLVPKRVTLRLSVWMLIASFALLGLNALHHPEERNHAKADCSASEAF